MANWSLREHDDVDWRTLDWLLSGRGRDMIALLLRESLARSAPHVRPWKHSRHPGRSRQSGERVLEHTVA